MDDKKKEEILNDERAALILIWDGKLENIEKECEFLEMKKRLGKMVTYGIIKSSESGWLGKGKTGYKLMGMGKKESKLSEIININVKASVKDVISELDEVIGDKTHAMNEGNQDLYISRAMQEGKACLILFTDTLPLSLSYRTLASHSLYTSHVNFYSYLNPSPTIQQRFQVTKLPQLLLLFMPPG